jgi:hypothetical protein
MWEFLYLCALWSMRRLGLPRKSIKEKPGSFPGFFNVTVSRNFFPFRLFIIVPQTGNTMELDYSIADAIAMIGKQYNFALNGQMNPLKCVVIGIDIERHRPTFSIDFNIDPGKGKEEMYETRLSRVEARFLFPIS